MIEYNTVVKGDCLDVLHQLPDDSIDMVFADPPFNLDKKYNSYQDNMGLTDYLEWCRSWIIQLVRVTKPTGSIFIHNIPKWLTYYASFLNEIADFKHWIAWDAMGSPLGKTLLPNHYGILYYAKNARLNKFYDLRYPHHRCRKCNVLRKDYGGKKAILHPFGPLVSDVWTDLHRIRHNKRRDAHPCQLPIPLLERLVLMATDEGDIVLDPFAGTGTSLVAANRLGRRYIGIELDEEYVQIARTNIDTNPPISQINGVWVSFYLDKIVTIRDCDWDSLRDYFWIPEKIEKIDTAPIVPKHSSSVRITHNGTWRPSALELPFANWEDKETP